MPLDPSTRVNLIANIASQLESVSPPSADLNLIFSQFDLPVPHQWGSDLYSHATSLLTDAEDEQLIGIARHLGIGVDHEDDTESFTYWVQGQFRVFITHIASQSHLARQIQEGLRVHRISSFVAHEDIVPTSDWQDEIERALRSAHALVALLHKGFHESDWTDQEVGFMLGRDRLVVGVRLGIDPYGFIARSQAISGHGGHATAIAAQLRRILCLNPRTRGEAAESLLQSLEYSRSYDHTRETMAIIEELGIWDASWPERLRATVEENSQVRDEHTAPQKIEALIRDWEAE